MAQPKDERELVAIWRSRLSRAEKAREEEQKTWKLIEKAIDGELRPSMSNWPEDQLWVGGEKTHSAIRSILPSLLYSNPKWTVTPKRPLMIPDARTGAVVDRSWELARVKELVLNHVWGETCGNKQARVAITSAFIAFGAAKVGYLPEFEDDEERGVFKTDEDGNWLVGPDGLPELSQGDFLRDADGAVVFSDDGRPELSPGKLLKEQFFVEYTHYDNLLFDPDGSNVFETTHSWVAEEIIRPLEDVQSDLRYKKSARMAVSPTNVVGDRPGEESRAPTQAQLDKMDEEQKAQEDDAARVKLFDIYDFKNRRILTIPAASGATHRVRNRKGQYTGLSKENNVILRDVPLPAHMEHGPFRYLRFNERPGKWYPTPDGRAMARLELEYNLTRSQQAEHRRNALPRWLEDIAGGFSEEEGGDIERRKFLTGGAYTITKVKSLNNSVRAAETPQLDATHFQALPQINNDFWEAAGSPSEFAGVAQSDTATQASIMATQADLRNSDRRDNVVQGFLGELGRLLLQTMAANMQTNLVIKVQGDVPDPIQPFQFMEVSPSDLEGEFDVEVAIGSTLPKNSQSRVRLLTDMVTAISQNPAIGLMPTLLRRLFEAADIRDETLMQEAMQMAQAAMGAAPGAQGPGTEQDLASTVANGAADMIAGMSTGSPVN